MHLISGFFNFRQDDLPLCHLHRLASYRHFFDHDHPGHLNFGDLHNLELLLDVGVFKIYPFDHVKREQTFKSNLCLLGRRPSTSSRTWTPPIPRINVWGRAEETLPNGHSQKFFGLKIWATCSCSQKVHFPDYWETLPNAIHIHRNYLNCERTLFVAKKEIYFPDY